ncbi:MAG: alpha/beta superfamily hydrolase [Lysobacterales bacterium]|jgi:alpha/beta superfamily hydrolase
MSEKVIYFAHGKESGPWGVKIKRLAEVAKELGFVVESPDYTSTMDPDERVQMLLAINPQADNLVLVGSSMGGYVSTVATSVLKAKGVFLMAPAFYVPFYQVKEPMPMTKNVTIVHGTHDDIVPAEHSKRYMEKYDQVQCHFLDSDHRLLNVLDEVDDIFRKFLISLQEDR